METENTIRLDSPNLFGNCGRKPKNIDSKDKQVKYVKPINRDQTKKKTTSRLPRFVRNGSFYRSNKNVVKQSAKEVTGTNVVGTSKRLSQMPKPQNIDPKEKHESSAVPGQNNAQEESIDNDKTVKVSSDRLVFEAKNVQRVQMLINADFCPEDRTQTTSVVSAKPIPTLGQIYRRHNFMENDRFHDWFMSLNTPLNSFESNPTLQLRPSTDYDDTMRGVIDVAMSTSCEEPLLVMDRANLIQQIFKSTNDNVSEWITSEMESTEINDESGYRSSSPLNREAADIKAKQTDDSSDINTHEDNWVDVSNKNNTLSFLVSKQCDIKGSTVQPIVIENEEDPKQFNDKKLEKTDEKVKVSKDGTYIFSKLFENSAYSPTTNEHSEQDEGSRKDTRRSSFAECPSETLQKTTNFEGSDSPETPSSIVSTDMDIGDDLSSQFTMEQIDDCCGLESQYEDNWASQCMSIGCKSFDQNILNDTEATSQFVNQGCSQNDDKLLDCSNSQQNYRNQKSWKKQDLRQNSKIKNLKEKKRRCVKCQRFKRYPSTRYQNGSCENGIDSSRKQLAIKICRKKWNHVWKKTAERWAHWSKSPSKVKKIRMMHYLQRPIIWEDAKVQTSLFVYRETGTDKVLREQKSAAISALFKLPTEWNTHAECSGTSNAELKMKNFSIQAMPVITTFTHTRPKLMSISSAVMKSASVIASHKEMIDTGVSTKALNGNEVCSASMYLPKCQCHRSDHKFDEQCLSPISISSYIIEAQTQPNQSDIKNGVQNKASIKEKMSIAVYADIEINLPVVLESSTSPINLNCPVINKMSTGIYAAPDQHIMPTLISRPTTCDTVFTKHKSVSTIAMNTDFEARIKEITRNACGTKRELIIEKNLNWNNAYANVEIEVKPILVEQATEFMYKSNVQDEKTVHISVASCTEGSLPKLEVQNDVMNMETTVFENKAVSTKTIPKQEKPILIDHSTSVASNTILASRKSESISTFVQLEREFQPILTNTTEVGNKTSIKNKSDTIQSYGDIQKRMETEFFEQITGFGQFEQPSLEEKSVSTITYCNIDVETQPVSQMQECIGTSKSLVKSVEKISGKKPSRNKSDEKPTPSSYIGHSVLMSAYTLTQSVAEMTTQTEQEYNDAETSSDAFLQFNYQQPNQASNCTTKSTQALSMFKIDDFKKNGKCRCAVLTYDNGTNTELRIIQCTECATQTKSTHQRNAKITSACNQIPSKISKKRSPIIHDAMKDKILSLSRLIGQRYPYLDNNSEKHPNSMPSSALNASNWIRKCASLQKGEYAYQFLQNEKSLFEDLKPLSLETVCSTSAMKTANSADKNKQENNVVPTSPKITLSNDSLQDVIPVKTDLEKHKNSIAKCSNNIRTMIDKATSGTRDVREFNLQASPEICNAATDFTAFTNQKSASAITSRCLLPTTTRCLQSKSFPNELSACVFVYREPRCVVHNQQTDAAIQKQPSNHDVEVEPIYMDHIMHEKKTGNDVGEVLSPKVYKALYDTTKLVFKEVLKPCQDSPFLTKQQSVTKTSNISRPLETDIKFPMAQRLEVHSATMMTSNYSRSNAHVYKLKQCVEQSIQTDNAVKKNNRETDVNTQTQSSFGVSFVDLTHDKTDCSEECVKTHLAASCRYYSNLLSKHIGRVKENLTKHLAPPTEAYQCETHLGKVVEACTMKPSARHEQSCQTFKLRRYSEIKKTASHILSPSSSLTDICRHDREHLKSVYFILSAIEGRIRRLKTHVRS